MNKTVDNISIPAICNNCQTSYGLSSADRRSIIVMVVLTGVALILCYVGVLLFAIRTRFIPDKESLIMSENIHENSVFNADDVQNEDKEENLQGAVNTTAITTAPQPAIIVLENDNERF
ncbi:unnamed protein product [Rotaria sp. Silwood2]|nr:unnamed protein product [Rotaria sp. Silwood2]CAF2741977.1 unnamed protein product [Rotaria sp. Silwood2]CAF3193102.1 unnamed protein product [Rotaria sp. Silwood2]CAF4172094.1 unnamed protein product [Rotaria sp. Silwood2]CAF4225851.1 unnamed protein product [Rotaria sp. Silwood2]